MGPPLCPLRGAVSAGAEVRGNSSPGGMSGVPSPACCSPGRCARPCPFTSSPSYLVNCGMHVHAHTALCSLGPLACPPARQGRDPCLPCSSPRPLLALTGKKMLVATNDPVQKLHYLLASTLLESVHHHRLGILHEGCEGSIKAHKARLRGAVCMMAL